MSWGDLILALWLTALAALLVRGEAVYWVSIAFIDDDQLWPEMYSRLPDSHAMVFKPRYWTVWTKNQWIAWIARQPQASAQ